MAEAKVFRAGGVVEEKGEEVVAPSQTVSQLKIPSDEMTFKQLVEKWDPGLASE